MPGLRFSNFSVYGKNGRRIRFQTDATLEGESNAEQVIVDGEVAGSFRGVPTSQANIDAAICKDGEEGTQMMYDLLDSGEYETFVFGIIDARLISVSMMVKNFKYTGKASNGSTTFSCSLQGRKPKKVG